MLLLLLSCTLDLFDECKSSQDCKGRQSCEEMEVFHPLADSASDTAITLENRCTIPCEKAEDCPESECGGSCQKGICTLTLCP